MTTLDEDSESTAMFEDPPFSVWVEEVSPAGEGMLNFVSHMWFNSLLLQEDTVYVSCSDNEQTSTFTVKKYGNKIRIATYLLVLITHTS